MFCKMFCSADKIRFTFCVLFLCQLVSQSNIGQCQSYIEQGGQPVNTEVNKT